jgi:hypothetical protein
MNTMASLEDTFCPSAPLFPASFFGSINKNVSAAVGAWLDRTWLPSRSWETAVTSCAYTTKKKDEKVSCDGQDACTCYDIELPHVPHDSMNGQQTEATPAINHPLITQEFKADSES